MNNATDTSTTFKFLDAKLFVRRVRANPKIPLAHEAILKTVPARYNLTIAELKNLHVPPGAQVAIRRSGGPGSHSQTPPLRHDREHGLSRHHETLQFYTFRNQHVVMYVNGRQMTSEPLILDTEHEKTTVIAYKTLFEGSGIHHSDSGLQVTHDLYMNSYFMVLYALTPDLAASGGHTSPVEGDNIRIEATFKEALKEAITCLLYLEYNNSVLVDSTRTVTTDFLEREG